MKWLIYSILPLAILASTSLLGQMNTSTKEIVITPSNTPGTAPAQWREENISEAKNFYTIGSTFDQSSEYAELYSRSALSGIAPKNETGKVKVLTENNSVPEVYYNKAPAGTIIKLYNPDNGKSSYAIVVGKIAPLDSENFIVLVNEKTARNLSIKDYCTVQTTCYTDINPVLSTVSTR